LQSHQSAIACLLISEEIPRLELAAHDVAQQTLLSNFVSSHPWLQGLLLSNAIAAFLIATSWPNYNHFLLPISLLSFCVISE